MATHASSARICATRRYNPRIQPRTNSGPRLRLVPMPPPPRESEEERRRQYMAMDTLELVARQRSGDELAYDVLCERYLPLARRWARVRSRPGNPGHHDDNQVSASIEPLVRDATSTTIGTLGDIDRSGSLLLQLRNAIHERLRRSHRTEALDATIGPENAAAYEDALNRLKPEEREALVCVVEFQRDFEQLGKDLGVSSEDAARTYARAVVRLAEEMGHGR